jgi:putative phosphoserine phosphatase/1-acylglycerol-3-phosphate O-acyltransferase
MTKAPVIPVGLWGTEKVWPRSARLPNVLNIVAPPDVTVTVGAAVKLAYRSADADTKKIMKAIMAVLPPESRQQHEPSAEEIALAMPPGKKGDGSNETTRRPGKD